MLIRGSLVHAQKELRDYLHVRKDRKVKRSIKADKRKWIDNIAGEAEKAARNRAH